MGNHLEFWVLEKCQSYRYKWFRKKRLRNQKQDGVTNILYADRYKSEAEAIANAPDANWKPRLVNWFEEYDCQDAFHP